MGTAEVAWLTANLHRLIFPDKPEPSPLSFEGRDIDRRVIAAKMYGKPQCSVMWTGIAVGTIATAFSGWYALRGIGSLNWPTVQGQVVQSLYQETKEPSYKAEIKYTYTLDGVTYSNDDFGFFRSPSDDVVKQMVKAHPKGSAIEIYYDPARPSHSVVTPGFAPLGWLFCGLSVAPFLLVLPLMRHRTTRAQDALAMKYKVAMAERPRGIDFPTAIIRWTVAQESWRAALQIVRRRTLMSALRVLLIIALGWLATAYWIAPLMSGVYPAGAIKVMFALFALPMLSLFASVIKPASKRPPEYGIDADGILVPSRDRPIIRWSSIASFTVTSDPEYPQLRMLSLHLKSGSDRKIALPDGDAEHLVLAELSTHLPEGPPPPASSPLRHSDWMIGFAVAAVGWSCGLLLFGNMQAHHSEGWLPVALICALTAGPGTWIALLLRRRRAPQQLISFAGAVNLIATMGAALVTIILFWLRARS